MTSNLTCTADVYSFGCLLHELLYLEYVISAAIVSIADSDVRGCGLRHEHTGRTAFVPDRKISRFESAADMSAIIRSLLAALVRILANNSL